MKLLDWSFWIITVISFFTIVIMIRGQLLISKLRSENKKLFSQINLLKEENTTTKDDFDRIKDTFDQSSNEVESLNQQISNILTKNEKLEVKQIEEYNEKIKDLLQAQKNFIYRAITGASAEETNNLVISGLFSFVDEVSAKSKVIHDIAFKTKVLSFNASVEAERAGARGRGFSIVAQEMKRLAEISGKASEEIASLVERTKRGSQILNNQSEGDITNRVSVQTILIDINQNVETIQNKLNEYNSYLINLVNDTGETRSNLEYAYKVINQISKSQNEIKDRNGGVFGSRDYLAS